MLPYYIPCPAAIIDQKVFQVSVHQYNLDSFRSYARHQLANSSLTLFVRMCFAAADDVDGDDDDVARSTRLTHAATAAIALPMSEHGWCA